MLESKPFKSIEVVEINNKYYAITDYKLYSYLDRIYSDGTMEPILIIDDFNVYITPKDEKRERFNIYNYFDIPISKIINFDILSDDIKNNFILECLKE